MVEESVDVDVVVVGGGLAGIAAALELQAAGRRVQVIEAGPQLGGKACSVTTSRGLFPRGPTSFNGRYPVFWRLLAHLGLCDEAKRLHSRSRARYIVRDGRLAGIEPNPLKVLTTDALSLGDKWAFAKDLFSRRAIPSDEDESLDAFLSRRFGRPTVDKFLSAVMTGIFAGDLTRLSAQSCMPALVNAEREYGSVVWGLLKGLRGPPADGARLGVHTFELGMGRMAERASERLAVHLGATASAVTPAGSAVRVDVVQEGRETSLRARHVVLAVEAGPAAALVEPWAGEAAAVLRRFPYAPVALVHWVEDEPGSSKLPFGFGYLASPGEKCFALGTLFVGDLLGEERRRFSTFLGGALNPERAELSDEAMAEGIGSDLARLTSGRMGPLAYVQRWPVGVFQPPVGHHSLLKQLDAALTGQPVVLAGSYFGGAAMKDALMSGFGAAEALLRRGV
jgi:oxygen-dependent protoporphyrinogen oxidase